MERICGYIVLRKPEYATTKFHNYDMRVGQKTYRGIDRLRWEDIELAYHDNDLQPSLLPHWEELRRYDKDTSGLKLLKSYEQAREVFEFSRETSEIIAVWSPELAELKGTMNSEVQLEYLGLDCIALGEWSILLAGVYAKPDRFHWAIERLNDNGLLTSEDDCNAIFRQYVDLSSTDIVEPLADDARAENVRLFVPVP